MSRKNAIPNDRVVAFIDGFNLYHAIDDLNVDGPHDYLKWLNLRLLVEGFIPASGFDLVAIKYFSAFALWIDPDARKRHQAFVNALKTIEVETIMGKFKEKDRECHWCGNKWKAHEEKETDVNIAIHALNGAYKNEYDLALLITADSDLVPAIKMIMAETGKKVRLVFPLGLSSYELAITAGGMHCATEMKELHLRRSLFPREVKDREGNIVAIRPPKYDPPK